ncbi:MAG: 5'-nucleotidase C-terminal domain-containing protein [Raineya sp.]|jgi:2',3'-cyclic-nucleotide 2'-phosphodiesterase (5'-nucleotidase family)|nr:5'-nucleotidase C-terminal domain-containing protein [Raineya sp.]
MKYSTGLFSLLLVLLGGCTPSVYQLQSSKVAFIETRDTLTEDKEVAQIIEPYKKQLDAQMNQVIGYAEKEIQTNRRASETLLGNLVVDMIIEKARKTSKTKVDFAFVTFGGLRASIPAGAIKKGDIFELMPFENELVVLEVDGKTVRKLFEYMAVVRNMAISNTKIFIEGGKIKEVLIDDEPIEDNKTYYIATSDYLANGGDNLNFLKERKNMTFLNVKFRELIIESIEETQKKGKKINAEVGGRVQER